MPWPHAVFRQPGAGARDLGVALGIALLPVRGYGRDQSELLELAQELRPDAGPLHELCERAGITRDLARELEEFGLLEPRVENGDKRYGETDADIALACGKLSRYGIAPRHLRAFRTAADREGGLLEALVAPALRSRNPERRQAGLEDLQTLAGLAQDLSQLLFWRVLQHLAG